MRAWLLLLGGLIVWAAHFFGVYAVVLVEAPAARLWILIVTLMCLAADGAILVAALGPAREPADSFAAWIRSAAAMGVGLSLVAIVWQAMPALVAR